MALPPPPTTPRRDAPHAAREMAAMFDAVSPRYDLLNRLMTLGRDASWRAAMAREVPDDAGVVLDLCTGNGVSLRGLRRPGRLVVGADVSLRMLAEARDAQSRLGWAPRLLAADAFRLPIRSTSVHCVTIAFGIRNLRPADGALREIARVLAPTGRLVILEATAPSRGWLAPLHRFHLTHVLPWLGRLSPDPTAYAYLGRSILEFGPGDDLDRALGEAGFEIRGRRRFLLGAASLWVTDRAGHPPAAGGGSGALRPARSGVPPRGEMPTLAQRRATEWRRWTGVQLAVSAGIAVLLAYATIEFRRLSPDLPIQPWHRHVMGLLLLAGLAGFVVRSALLALRLLGAPPEP